jgi:hypothetical protein
VELGKATLAGRDSGRLFCHEGVRSSANEANCFPGRLVVKQFVEPLVACEPIPP